MQIRSQTKLALAVIMALVLITGPSTMIASPTLVKAQEAQQTQTQGFNVQVTADDVQRGNTQTIKVQADGAGAITGIVTYASGHKVLLRGETDESGAFEYPFTIGGNAKPGTFNVEIIAATDQGFGSNSTTFEVTKKGQVAVPAPEPVPEPIEPLPPQVIAPENETSVITPDNATDGGIEIPVNDTSITIPANETIVPEPSENDTAVIIVPENETEVANPENVTDVEPEIPEEIIEELPESPVIVAPGNESTVADNTTAEEPIEGNDTTTAPQEPVIVAPENETSVANPDNDTGIIPPVNDTSIIIPSNETTVPEPTQNETEIIIGPENETEIVTPDNATEVEEIPPEVIDIINDTSVVLPGNVSEVGENTTVSEPLPGDIIPADNASTVGNVSDIIVVPPGQGEITIPDNATQAGNATQLPFFNETLEVTPPIFFPSENETAGAAPAPNQTLPAIPPQEAIDNVDNASEDLEQAIDEGNQDEILRAMTQAISAQQEVVAVVDTATEEQKEDAQQKVEELTDLIDQAFSEVSP
jgi:hypothetical protein